MNKRLHRALLFMAFALTFSPVIAQKKYQSLLWEVSGNGLSKPSYLYGTMHISGKLVFQLGDPFYDAMQSVDVVALELEPENWLDDMFAEDGFSRGGSFGDEEEYGYFSGYGGGSVFLNHFVYSDEIQASVQGVLSYDPPLLNYMLFRFDNYGGGADFEENTWLDMYIYQTGKRLGKKTIGLESYYQSSYYGMLAEKEERNSKVQKRYDDKDRKKLFELQSQIESAYRRQDLDLVDSISNTTNGKSFNKYILYARNEVFVNTIDSVLKSGQSIFAGMGCAHLPGGEGVIESLRKMGYTIKALDKGTRDAKRRSKLDKLVYKREYSTYTTNDNFMSFQTPATVYPLGSNGEYMAWLAMDIPNGATFSTYRFKTYAGAHGYDAAFIQASIDSILYEAIPGKTISNKVGTTAGFPSMDILNKTSRGEGQRRKIIITPEEIIVLKLTASGDKVLKGFGSEFFDNFKLNYNQKNPSGHWTSPDKAVNVDIPGDLTFYDNLSKFSQQTYEEVTSIDGDKDYYTIYRITESEPGFIDEQSFINKDMAYFFGENNEYELIDEEPSSVSGFPSWKSSFKNKKGEIYHGQFLQVNLDNYAFIIRSNNAKKIANYFNSIKIQKPEYTKFWSYEDTVKLHYAVEIPYDLNDIQNELYYNFDWSNADDLNEDEGMRRTYYLDPPQSHESIQLKFRRYHRYHLEEDTLAFINETIKSLANDKWMVMTENSRKITPTGFRVHCTYTDTSSTRAIDALYELYNSTLYTLKSSFDTKLGRSEFLTHTFETFRPSDNYFKHSIFEDMSEVFIDNLYSTDSTTQKNALLLVEDVSLSNKSADRIRQTLKKLPEFEEKKDQESVKNSLLAELYRDTSMVNIDFLTQEYYVNTDSANIQLRILQNLGWMDTKDATLRFKKLLLDEPPIGGRLNSFSPLSTLRDSLELAKLVFPEAFSLVSLNEYESSTYSLLATLVDSNAVSSKTYENNLNLILLEAKNELKRVNGTDETAYNFDTSTLLDYCSILLPYKKKPEVEAFFNKIYKTKKNKLLLDMIDFNHDHKIQTPDSIINKIASDKDIKLSLYIRLMNNDMLNQLHVEWNNPDSLVNFYCKNAYESKYNRENKIDDIKVIQSFVDTLKGQPYQVYYVKFKRKNEMDWRGTVIALKKSEDLWSNTVWKPQDTVVIETNEDELEEISRVYKALVREHREPSGGSNNYWNSFDYSYD